MKTDGLDDAFNVETSIVPADIEKVQKKEKPSADHISKDYEYTRGNLYSIIEKVKKQSMVFLNLLKKVKCQEHMKLLVNNKERC